MTTITYSLEQWQNLLHQVVPVEQLEARAREFAHRIGLVAQSQETLAAQYAAEQKAAMAKSNRYALLCIELAGSVEEAERIMELIARDEDCADLKATQEAAR